MYCELKSSRDFRIALCQTRKGFRYYRLLPANSHYFYSALLVFLTNDDVVGQSFYLTPRLFFLVREGVDSPRREIPGSLGFPMV